MADTIVTRPFAFDNSFKLFNYLILTNSNNLNFKHFLFSHMCHTTHSLPQGVITVPVGKQMHSQIHSNKLTNSPPPPLQNTQTHRHSKNQTKAQTFSFVPPHREQSQILCAFVGRILIIVIVSDFV